MRTSTEQTPTYQGRPFDRPDEELTDQGLRFDVVTVLNRRNMLRALSLSATAITLAACGADSTTSGTPSSSMGEIPHETAGPYPGDGSNGPDVLEQTGTIRSDIRSSFGEASGTAEGVLMTLQLGTTDLADDGAPFPGVAVNVWHCAATAATPCTPTESPRRTTFAASRSPTTKAP